MAWRTVTRDEILQRVAWCALTAIAVAMGLAVESPAAAPTGEVKIGLAAEPSSSFSGCRSYHLS